MQSYKVSQTMPQNTNQLKMGRKRLGLLGEVVGLKLKERQTVSLSLRLKQNNNARNVYAVEMTTTHGDIQFPVV